MAAGCTPQSIQSRAVAYSTAKMAGWAMDVARISRSAAPLSQLIPAGIEDVTQIGVQKGLQELGACIEMTAKFRLLIVEAATHFRILGSLARKHEDNGRILTARASRAYLAGGKRRHGLVAVTAQQCRTMEKSRRPTCRVWAISARRCSGCWPICSAKLPQTCSSADFAARGKHHELGAVRFWPPDAELTAPPPERHEHWFRRFQRRSPRHAAGRPRGAIRRTRQ